MESAEISSEEVALRYLEQLPWPPYPFQEQAILSWFEKDDGLLVCAPTGSGKTVVAETAMFEALLTGRRAYYTTPLIALTEQKFYELRESAVRWGFSADDVGLVTGNRRINPDARLLVVVAEILLNRLLSPEEFPFDDVSAVVMDEFHSFNDIERGIVWELSLGILPKHVRVLLISATVGNAADFVVWLARQHGRRLRLLQSEERRVPLTFTWVGDEMLSDHLEKMADGEDENRYTPALVFCFNRNECWSVAEQLKGKRLLADGQQKQLQAELDQVDWSIGAGGKLKQILIRGVGIHHAGLLPKYRRIIEKLFQKKLLSICVCTETLAAGINLPARSVVMTSLLKGPPGRMKVIEASSAHQMFGRAGRPQFDSRGFVFAVAHEDDVRLFRWQEKYDAIPEDTRDPMLIKAKKNLKKKMPKRREGQQYWTERQFEVLQTAPPARLSSRGRFPWRLLAFLIRKTGSVMTMQETVRKRLLDSDQKDDAERLLKRMLITLDAAGMISLDPVPPGRAGTSESGDDKSMSDRPFHSVIAGSGGGASLLPKDGTVWTATRSRWTTGEQEKLEIGEVHDFSSTALSDEEVDAFGLGIFADDDAAQDANENTETLNVSETTESVEPANVLPADSNASMTSPVAAEAVEKQPTTTGELPTSGGGLLGKLIQEAMETGQASTSVAKKKSQATASSGTSSGRLDDAGSLITYEPKLAIPTDQLPLLFAFRSINPLYGMFLAEHMHLANYEERLQLLEAVLDMPRSVSGMVRVPFPDQMPPGPLASDYLNQKLISRGLVTVDELQGFRDEETGRRIPPLVLGDKMRLLFRSEYPGVDDVFSTSVWCVGDLLRYGGNFDRYVRARELTKQEGVIFRHCLRLILLCGEFSQIEPPNIDPAEWRTDLAELASILTDSCRAVDPDSTDEVVEALQNQTLNPDQL
ncbi:MAG: DEAD/DEAH box helicase [Planctomycetaceae bacterium]